MEIEQNVSAYIGEKDNIYDFDNKLINEEYSLQIVKKLIDYGKNLAELSVLDLGLGYGQSSQVFGKYFRDYSILEGDSRIIKSYLKKYPDTHINITETFFENYTAQKKYDVIIFGFVLEHVDDPIAILKQYSKYLNKDGIIYISVPNAEALNRRLGKIMGILDDLTELSLNDIQVGHKRYYTVDSLKNDILQAGLNLVALQGIYMKPFTTKQMASLQLSEDVYHALCVVGHEYPELSLGILAEISK